MLESQRNLDQGVNEEGTFLGQRLQRVNSYSPRKDVGTTDCSIAMDYPPYQSRIVRDVSGASRASNASTRSWQETRERVASGTVRCCIDLGRELFVQTWRDRPRDVGSIVSLLRRNVVAFLLVLCSGIITWESSVDDLRTRIDRTIVFPLYLPQSVALAVACVWTTAVAPGTYLGLYLVRMYMIWRLHLGFTSLNTTIMLLVAFLATMQSHIGAFFLRKFLCNGTVKRIPTIDSVVDAVWYLVTVFVLSLVFCMLIALCLTATPLIQWSSFWRYWTTWWLGVLATMITVTPLLMHLFVWDYQSSLRSPGKLLECVLVALTTSAAMVVVFFLNFEYFRPLPYLCFPLITWTAFRFNRVGWAITVSVIAYCCALGSVRKRGAFYNLSSGMPVSSPTLIIQIELFSCVMGVVGITLAAAVREKQHLTRKLHQLNGELEETVDMRTLELRKANEELQVSQRKAEQASHAKSDFLANMSHEIRTPIHGILGLTALLLESELTPDQEESLVSVKECADLLLHIINSVLDLAKIEAGRLEVEKVPFNIRKMVSSTFRMLQARAQQRGLQLLWEVDKSVPQTLVGDIGKLQQCLMNLDNGKVGQVMKNNRKLVPPLLLTWLVGNALKFTHKGSVTVGVRVVAEDTTMPLSTHDELGDRGNGSSGTKPVENPLHPDSMFVEFEVRDTGIGISEEKLLDMFKPFTQADASTSRLYGGTGLGLCIVQRFVELLGGTIWAESEVGKGSTFHFRLPFLLNSPKESPAEMSPKISSKNYSDKFNGRQSWSLMGGLIFNPPGKYQSESNQLESGVETRTSNLSTRGRSTNDLLGLWKDNRGGHTALDDSDSNNSSPRVTGCSTTAFQDTTRRSGLVVQGSSGKFSWTSPERLQGGSDAGVSEQRSLEKALSDPANQQYSVSGNKWESSRSDRSASNEVTQLVPKESWELPVRPQNFVLASSQNLSSPFSDNWGGVGSVLQPRELGPMDSDTPNGEETSSGVAERERGNYVTGPSAGNIVITSVGALLVDLASLRSDLSRESSAELENLLVSKVRLNILLAEDNAINQKVASRQLEKHGHVVTIVGDGQQALDVMCLQHDDFDLVLMDVQMPVMDGLKATDLIRKAESENGWTRVPILGLTAHAIQGYQDTCLQYGMDGYLGKPFDIHQLLKTIGHLLPPDTLGQHTLSR